MAFKTTSEDTLRSSGKENRNDSGRTIGAAILENPRLIDLPSRPHKTQTVRKCAQTKDYHQ